MSNPRRTEETLKIFRYEHGGARIYFEDGDARELVADTYQELDREVIYEAIRATLAPTPAQAREDEALLKLPRYNPRPAYGTNALPDMRPDPQYGQWVRWSELQATIAALRSRQSPPPAISPSRLAWKIGNAVMGYLWPDEDDDDLTPSPEGIRAAIKNAVHDVLAGAPQPSPQGEDAEAFRKRMVMRFQAMRRQYRDEGRTEWLDDAEADWVMDALRASLASLDASVTDKEAIIKAHIAYEEELLAKLEARLASAQSSDQGEEARDDEPLSYMNRAELQLNIMRNIEREIKNLSRDNEGDEGFSLRYWWNKTANWAKVQRILNGNTHKAGSTSSTAQCRFIGADPDGYSFAEARAALERKEGE